MRLVVKFLARDNFIPLNYRPFVMSFIKKAISRRYPELFNMLYREDSRAQKNFCFAAVLDNFKVEGDRIYLRDGVFCVIISSYDKDLMVKFYNAVRSLRGDITEIPSYKTSVEMIKYDMVFKEEIESEVVKIKFLSPLLVRQKEAGLDSYLYWDDAEFNRCLQLNIDKMIQEFSFKVRESSCITLTPVNPGKVVVKAKQTYINANKGVYFLQGEKELLNFLYLSGIGSRRSQGFGLFELEY